MIITACSSGARPSTTSTAQTSGRTSAAAESSPSAGASSVAAPASAAASEPGLRAPASSHPVIVVDPGHAPTITHTDAATGLIDSDYENEPEMRDVFAVAQLVQAKLRPLATGSS